MVKIDVGGSQSRPATVPGTPKEISSASGQNVPPQTNVPSTGTKKRMYLMECDEDVATGKTNYCRRIPIYDEPIPGTVPDSPGKAPEVSPGVPRKATANGECTSAVCDLSRRLPRRLGQSTSQKADGEEEPKKDKFF